MDASIHDYTKQNAPKLHLNKAIHHPTNNLKVIGHIGIDKAAKDSEQVAVFPRRKDEHWFRGDSSDGLTGYGISEDVLGVLRKRPNQSPIGRLVIVETDNGRVIEYDFASFKNATVVAYSPKKDAAVIGDESMRVDDDLYSDRQRVVPIEEARRTFDRDDVTIYQ